jgi:hypothetical protein
MDVHRLFLLVGPLPLDQITVPLENRFRLNKVDGIAQLLQ